MEWNSGNAYSTFIRSLALALNVVIPSMSTNTGWFDGHILIGNFLRMELQAYLCNAPTLVPYYFNHPTQDIVTKTT